MNSDILTIDDKVTKTNIQARRDFGEKIKELVANKDQWLHAKGKDAIQVPSIQRLVITLNEGPEKLLILPPLGDGTSDKLMLFKVAAHPMPMPTATGSDHAVFFDALVAELPAFMHFIKCWTIPSELLINRYGVKPYHHPELVEALNEMSPEDHLRDLIDEVIFHPLFGQSSWKGKAKDLDRALKSAASITIQREAKDLLPAPNSCGKYLDRLATNYPDRFKKRNGRAGVREWEIIRDSSGLIGCQESLVADSMPVPLQVLPHSQLHNSGMSKGVVRLLARLAAGSESAAAALSGGSQQQ